MVREEIVPTINNEQPLANFQWLYLNNSMPVLSPAMSNLFDRHAIAFFTTNVKMTEGMKLISKYMQKLSIIVS